MTARPRVVVCGTKFGRVYLAAFNDPAFPFELAGVVGRGSERSYNCASRYGVPLYTSVDDVPDDVTLACVVVGAGINGGPGAQLAQDLLARGMHVLQEHPLHHDELAECLRAAQRHGRVYHLNTHYVHVEPVRRFVDAVRDVAREQRPLFVDATTSVQVAYTLFDVLGAALGGLRPWVFADAPTWPDDVRTVAGSNPPYRSLDGVVAGVPLTLRTQHQLDPAEPDNFSHTFHRVTVGFEGGTLTLVNTYGPVVWSPRPHLPASAAVTPTLHEAPAPHFDFPSARVVGPADAPSYRAVLESIWPAAVRRAISELYRAVVTGEDQRRRGQHHLTLCKLVQDANARLGPVEIVHRQPPMVLSGERLVAVLPDGPLP